MRDVRAMAGKATPPAHCALFNHGTCRVGCAALKVVTVVAKGRGRVSALLCAALLSCAPAAGGADVALYSIVKERQFAQTGDTPVQAPGDAFRFTAAVVVSSNGVVNGATVQRGAGGTVFPLTNSTPPGVFIFTQAFASQAALDAAFPSATSYTIAMQTGAGPRTPQLTFGTLAYPNAPRVRSFSALQMADSQSALNLQWDAFTGATTNDVIQVLIEDGPSNTVFSSPLAGSPGALNGLATNITVPAGTLAPARTYTATLVFARVQINANNFLFIYPGVPGASVFAARTRFTLQTAPRSATIQPRLRVTSTTPSAVTVSFDAEIGAAYRLLAATNPAQVLWTTLLTTNAAGTNVTFTDGAVGLNKERYFRVVSP